MEKKINKKALILSLIFALASCALIFNYIRNLDIPQEIKPQIKLLVAARNINAGEEVKAEDINSIDITEDALPLGVINDRKYIEGFYAQEPIIMGEPFRKERLAEQEELTLSFNIPDGMRALSVFVNENTIFSNQLRVGDRVDVIGNYEIVTLNDKTIDLSKITIQDVEVLAIGPNRVQKSTENAISDTVDENNLPRTITLCVTPGDAEKMAYITAFADFTLALRGHDDDKKVNTPGVIIGNITPSLGVQ